MRTRKPKAKKPDLGPLEDLRQRFGTPPASILREVYRTWKHSSERNWFMLAVVIDILRRAGFDDEPLPDTPERAIEKGWRFKEATINCRLNGWNEWEGKLKFQKTFGSDAYQKEVSFSFVAKLDLDLYKPSKCESASNLSPEEIEKIERFCGLVTEPEPVTAGDREFLRRCKIALAEQD